MTDSERTPLWGPSPLLLLGFPPSSRARGSGAWQTLTPPSPLGCWGLVAMAMGCTLSQLSGRRVLAARLPEGHGLPSAAVLQIRDYVEVGAGRAEGGEEGLNTTRKKKKKKVFDPDLCTSRLCPLAWGLQPHRIGGTKTV